jgi:hypothetical protein
LATVFLGYRARDLAAQVRQRSTAFFSSKRNKFGVAIFAILIAVYCYYSFRAVKEKGAAAGGVLSKAETRAKVSANCHFKPERQNQYPTPLIPYKVKDHVGSSSASTVGTDIPSVKNNMVRLYCELDNGSVKSVNGIWLCGGILLTVGHFLSVVKDGTKRETYFGSVKFPAGSLCRLP